MKIRNSFVSNSSSSSYIIGATKVNNLEQAKLLKEKSKWNCEIISTTQILEGKTEYVSASFYGGKKTTYCVEAFNGSSIEFIIDPAKEEYWFTLLYCGNEGDGFFDPECEGDYNYDMDLDQFPKDIQAIASAIWAGSDGLDKGKCYYGAGRNG